MFKKYFMLRYQKIPILLLIILLVILPTFGFAQNRHLIDSLMLNLKIAKEDTSKIKLLNQISEEYSFVEKDSAILYAEKLYTISQTINSIEQKFQSAMLLSNRYLEKGINTKSLEFSLLSLKFAEASGNKEHLVTANEFIATLYANNLKNLPKALEYGNRALSLSKEIKDPFIILKNLESISTVYFNFEKFDEALNYSIEEYHLALSTGDSTAIVHALSNMGDGYRAKKKFPEAINFYTKAINILRPSSYNPNLFFAYNNIGVIFKDSGDYKTAIKYFLSASEIAKRDETKDMLSFNYQNISRAYLKLKDYQNALKYNLLSIEYEEASGTLPNLKLLYLLNATINDSLRNYKAAYTALNKYVAINNDSVNNETRNKITEMEVALELEKNQSKIDSITKDKTQQKIIRNSFIAGTILLLLLIIVLVNRNKLKRGIDMEKMRSRLSRDLHDDIGSTLSSINILSRTAQSNLKEVDDEKIKTSLKKINERSQRLLDNMSDIIWNINPGNDTIEEVMSRMREYATTILEAKNIDYTFDFPKQKMDCKLNMEVKNNLYLIFKEAVNNLTKYAACTHAKLSLSFDEKNIHLTIEDNGIGFNEQEIRHQGGLVNMQQRALEIKGIIKIHTVINKGTLIALTMPRYC